MKTLYCAVLVPTLVFSGCQGQPENPVRPGPSTEPVFDSIAGPVTVLALHHDEEEKTIEAMLLVRGGLRQLMIRPYENSDLPVGIAAELSDGGGALLFGLEVAWDPKQPGLLRLAERTATDMLTMTICSDGDRSREEYLANGRKFAVEYRRKGLDLRRKSLALQRAGMQSQALSSAMDALDVKLEGVDRFYLDNVGATLCDNPDGEVLVDLLTNAKFVAEGLEIGDGWFSNLGKNADRVCTFTLRCASLKCKWGGWANPACVACAGTASACVIASIACHFVDCGNTEEGKEEK